MNSHNEMRRASVGLLVVIFSTVACSVSGTLPLMATATPLPTNTPHPTLTPLPPTPTPVPPTATPIPERWNVYVVSVTKDQQFGGYSFDESQKAEFLIVTVQYTNMGQDVAEFYPMSVELLFPTGSSSPGTAFSASCYQPDGISKVTNFVNEQAYLTLVKPGQTKTEKFAWGLRAAGDTKYTLLFPETKPIDIIVGN